MWLFWDIYLDNGHSVSRTGGGEFRVLVARRLLWDGTNRGSRGDILVNLHRAAPYYRVRYILDCLYQFVPELCCAVEKEFHPNRGREESQKRICDDRYFYNCFLVL